MALSRYAGRWGGSGKTQRDYGDSRGESVFKKDADRTELKR
jgi:hypothetical protein